MFITEPIINKFNLIEKEYKYLGYYNIKRYSQKIHKNFRGKISPQSLLHSEVAPLHNEQKKIYAFLY